jgi:hypothetical protein
VLPPDLEQRLNRLFAAAADNDKELTVTLLHEILPDYQLARRAPVVAGVGALYPDGL